MSTTVVVGNPRGASRTTGAGLRLAELLTGKPADNCVDLAELGAGLLTPDDEAVALAVRLVQESALVVFASPTYKGSYTGLMKMFLDRFQASYGLIGVVTVPLMLGAGLGHAMAPELLFRPLLAELGGTCALPGLFLLDASYTEDLQIERYAERWAPVVAALGAGWDPNELQAL